MTGTVVHVCGTCAAGQADQSGVHAALAAALKGRDLPVDVRQSVCMSGCARPMALAFRAPGKVAYLFGDIGLADVTDLVRFAELYLLSIDGAFDDARLLGGLRLKVIARIPG